MGPLSVWSVQWQRQGQSSLVASGRLSWLQNLRTLEEVTFELSREEWIEGLIPCGREKALQSAGAALRRCGGRKGHGCQRARKRVSVSEHVQ